MTETDTPTAVPTAAVHTSAASTQELNELNTIHFVMYTATKVTYANLVNIISTN